MANLSLTINVETIDFRSENFDTEVRQIKSYQFSSEMITTDFVDQLNILMIRTKGDWIKFSYDYFNQNYYVTANLIFHDKQLTIQEENLVNQVIRACEQFFAEKNLQQTNQEYNNFDKLCNILSREGFILSISELDGCGKLNYEELALLLRENNIPFEILNGHQSRFDGGASGGSGSLIFFILGSIASGATWDVIKLAFSKKFDFPFEELSYLRITKFENYKFNKLRNILAERIREEEQDLILREILKDDNEIILVFKTPKKTVHVRCDSNYDIKEMNVDENVA
ncbi:MAG: hypothetical protein ACOYVK_20730 [Bacillota bacterium]